MFCLQEQNRSDYEKGEGGLKMEIKENKCDKCKYRWEMNKKHCNKCKNNPDNVPIERKGEEDNFESME